MTADNRLLARFNLLSIQLERVKAAHALAEDALVRHDTRIDEWYAENLKRDPTDAAFVAYLSKLQKDDLTQGYALVLRSALFATAYGALEQFMISVCRSIEPNVRGPGLDDLRGDGIRRAHLFLNKVAGASLSDSSEWQLLVLYGKLRNALVHALGDPTQSRSIEDIRNLAARVKTFSVLEDDHRVVLTSAFTPTFVDTASTFAGQVDEALAQHTVFS